MGSAPATGTGCAASCAARTPTWGWALAAIAPPLLRELAGELLGHPPRADDLPRLRGELDGRVRDLLPGLPPPVLETLLTRVCRMPPPRASGEQPHAADSAVTAGVATAVLLARLGRDLPAGGANEPAAADKRTARRAPARGGAGQPRGPGGRPARDSRAGPDSRRARARASAGLFSGPGAALRWPAAAPRWPAAAHGWCAAPLRWCAAALG